MFFPLTTQSSRITWARCIPLNLRSKTRPRATLLRLTWIYFCRSGETVNFILPFMINVTIPISISQIFISWVATYQIRPPMASFLNLYDITRACSSYGGFILRATRLSNKLLEQGYAKEHLKSSLKKCYGRYGDLIKQYMYEVPLSQMLNDIL